MILNRVDESKRELADETAVEGAIQRCPPIRIINDAADCFVNLLRKGDAETGLLEFVIFNTGDEFFSGGWREFILHF